MDLPIADSVKGLRRLYPTVPLGSAVLQPVTTINNTPGIKGDRALTTSSRIMQPALTKRKTCCEPD
jgi:hypothetical protein